MNQYEFDLYLGFNSQRSKMLSSFPKYPAWASNPTSILFNGYWKAISQVLKCQYQAADHSSMWNGLHLLICTSHISCKWNVHHPFIITMTTMAVNLLKPNDIYICRTAALTSRHYILNIYSTNIHTEYFKHAA